MTSCLSYSSIRCVYCFQHNLHQTQAHVNLQRWIYRIDPKRVNEYGQVLLPEEETVVDGKGVKESKKTK